VRLEGYEEIGQAQSLPLTVYDDWLKLPTIFHPYATPSGEEAWGKPSPLRL